VGLVAHREGEPQYPPDARLVVVFLTDVVGLKPYLAAAVFVGRSWDYINDGLLPKYRMNLGERSDLVFALLFVVALLSFPFWNWVSCRWDKHRAYILDNGVHGHHHGGNRCVNFSSSHP